MRNQNKFECKKCKKKVKKNKTTEYLGKIKLCTECYCNKIEEEDYEGIPIIKNRSCGFTEVEGFQSDLHISDAKRFNKMFLNIKEKEKSNV